MSGRADLRVWRWPVALSVLIAVGLAAALLGEGGAWWGLSWAALAVPLATIAVALARSRRRARSGRSNAGAARPS
ncbi:hypothetical protein [Rhodopseudomonas sp. B29]|uniref:hypothetical protein n=1 Tax=Rhodopseudomonas sp. B29 TaxID=95607 RepID=UPI0003B5AC7F|nr:hypothetical protein [Rhodopseudomonas sp. B29]